MVRLLMPSCDGQTRPPRSSSAPTNRSSGPALRFFVYHACEIRLAPEQLAKIGDIEAEERALARRDDGRIAWTTGEEGHFAKEVSRPEVYRLGLHLNLDVARNDKIHAISWLTAANNCRPGSVIARP